MGGRGRASIAAVVAQGTREVGGHLGMCPGEVERAFDTRTQAHVCINTRACALRHACALARIRTHARIHSCVWGFAWFGFLMALLL